MYKIILSLIIFISFLKADEIRFETGTLNDVSVKAASENKIIFVDVYADWCAPCKWMAANVFTNDSVADFFNSTFVNWTIDAEKGDGPEFAKKYEVKFYPTFLFLDGSGNVVHKIIGSMQPQEFLAAAKTAANPDANLAAMKTLYQFGKRDKDFLKGYIRALNMSYMPADEIYNEYFKLLTDNEKITEEHYELVTGMSSPDNDLFRFFAANTALFRQYDDEFMSAESLVGNVYMSYVQSNAKKMNDTEMNKLLTDIRQLNNPALSGLDVNMNIIYYGTKKDWNKFTDNVNVYINKYMKDEENVVSAQKLNGWAWTMYEGTNDMKLLKKARDWAKLSVKKDETFYNLDTYAALLYKTGNKKKALTYYKKAVKAADKYGEDAAPQKEMVKKIEKELDD